MRKSITLRAFPPEMDITSRVELARAAGYVGVEVNLEPGEEYHLESSEADLRRLRREIESRGMQVSSAYSRQQWYYPLTSKHTEIRQHGEEIIKRLAWAATLLGTDAILVVPGAVDNSLFAAQPETVPYDVAYCSAKESLCRIVQEVGERYRVFLAVENVWNKFLLSPLEFVRFIDEIASPWIGAYFDVGNVLRTGFPEHWIPILGHRIKRVHLKDFRLSVDNAGGFVGLLEGDVNWPAVITALKSIGYDSWVTTEVLPAYRYFGERLVYETSASVDAILSIQR
jgi:L-ribulose-5-phosphate 3-epimerase